MTPRLAIDQLHRAALVRGDAEALTVDGARLTFGELAAEATRDAFKPVRDGFANLRKAA